MILDKTAFLTPSKVNGPFEVEGFGEVWIKEVPAEAGDYIHQADTPDSLSVGFRIIIASVCDENGEPIFSRDDFDAIRKTPVTRISKLMQLATEHCGFGDEVEDVLGN